MIIDAHQHFWDRSDQRFDHTWQEAPGLEKICRSFLPGDLSPLATSKGVSGTVFVQTQHHLEETRWALSLAEASNLIVGVVGWVDLASEQCSEQLSEFQRDPYLVGIRHVVQDESDDDFILRDDISQGLALLQNQGMPFDLLFYERHLKHAATVARRFPDLPLVINHLSKPNIRQHSIAVWQKELAAAAQFKNVFCKLSGMVTEASWEAWELDDLRPYYEVALDCFGPDRLMFGSDWPVCELAATYAEVFDAASQLISGLSDTEQAKIMGGTARAFYKIDA